jgi:hypothetical protein
MTDRDLALRRIQKMEESLSASGGKDDSRGSRRAAIAAVYERIGEMNQAAHWYIEAAKYAEFSEAPFAALAKAKHAKRIAPDNLVAHREYVRLWEKYGPGEPPPV